MSRSLFAVTVFLIFQGCCYMPLVDCTPQHSPLAVQLNLPKNCTDIDGITAVHLKQQRTSVNSKIIVYLPFRESYVISQILAEYVDGHKIEENKFEIRNTSGKTIPFVEYQDDELIFKLTIKDEVVPKKSNLILQMTLLSTLDSSEVCELEMLIRFLD